MNLFPAQLMLFFTNPFHIQENSYAVPGLLNVLWGIKSIKKGKKILNPDLHTIWNFKKILLLQNVSRDLVNSYNDGVLSGVPTEFHTLSS